MKKIIVGMFCGLLLSIPMISFADNYIQAILFPSKVSFHSTDGVLDIENTKENEILNYNNKTYIPLRVFAEAMGANVAFESASAHGDGLNKIDVAQSPTINWSLKRATKPSEVCTDIPFMSTVTYNPGDDGSVGVVPIEKQSTFQVHLTNYMQENIIMDPIDITFEIYTMDRKTEGIGTLVYTRPLPTIEGLLPSKFGYDATITWDQKGRDGKVMTPGYYFVKIKRPFEISYTVEGSTVLKKVNITRQMGCNLDFFRIEFK